jgi:hypothetical protein
VPRLAFVAPTLVLGKLSYLVRNKQPDRLHRLNEIWKNVKSDICYSFEELLFDQCFLPYSLKIAE